ncbi:Ssl1-like-domain-containing protein [Phlyctochytrium arcticum]|nr:Ssl1-like-domain-containing protein [Phlyctochytrium arcticum]
MAATLRPPKSRTGNATGTIVIDDDEGHGLLGASGEGYSWEEEYKRSWDILQEDEQGSLNSVVANIQQQLKRRRLNQGDAATIQRGIIRHVFLVIDMSRAMGELDLKPSRMECTLRFAEEFINEFFDQNPLSQLGVIITRDALAEKVTDLTGNPTEHIAALQNRANREFRGEPSLQNALDLARTSLSHVPSHGSREILVLFGSLTTCDPDDITITTSLLKSDAIRVSMVGLSAEVQVCKEICKVTHGTYHVVLNEMHYREVLFDHIPPPPLAQEKEAASVIRMGFPISRKYKHPTLCACHQKLIRKGFVCPQCATSVCDLPVECPVCTLTLVSSPLLARSYHHLFPIANFKELPCKTSVSTNAPASGPSSRSLPSSSMELAHMGSGRFECKRCKHQFCLDCDVFVHDVLHNCPGCISGK